MNVSGMRWIDRWVGVPACFVMTRWRRVVDWFRREPPARPRKILFVKLAEQGATVLGAPCLGRAVELVGRENVYFVAFEENRFILDVMKLIPEANVITIRHEGLMTAGVQLLSAIRKIRKLDIDAAIDLEFFARSSAILTYLSGAARRVGFHPYEREGPYRGDLMTHRVRFNPHLHTSQTYQLMVEALTIEAAALPAFDRPVPAADEPPPLFEASPGEVKAVRGIVAEAAGATPGRLLLLNANCSDLLPLRRWPEANFIDLTHRLLDAHPDLYVAFTGAPDEAEAVDALLQRIGAERCFSLAGRTTLRQLLVAYGLAEVLITNDSGPAHFASLTPIDVIVMFGPEHPKLFAARTPRTHVFWAGLPCSPCVSALNNRVSACEDNVCMQTIEVDAVLAKALALLEARA